MVRRRNAHKSQKQKKTDKRYMRFMVTGIIFLFITFIGYDRTVYFFKNTELFVVREIVKAPSLKFVTSGHLTRLQGKNIFDIDLKVVEKRLRLQYPDIKHLRVSRRFPNKIYVTAQRRKPFASVTVNNRNILVDKDGVILSVDAAANSRLPTILGVKLSRQVIAGMPLRAEEMGIALDIIQTVQNNERLASLYISSVDVSNLSKIDCYLSDNLKIIIDEKKIYQKIRKLGIVLSEGNLNVKDINYIDLRFKEPILGKR